jgi:hypothetical protein
MTPFYLGYSPISDPSSVATFLLENFTNIVEVYARWIPDPSYFQAWKVVEELLAEKRSTLTL